MILDNDKVIDRDIMLRTACPESEFSRPFIQGMLNRMGVSFFKYGKAKDSKGKVDHIASALVRIQRFQEDGNGEWLIDAANMMMLAFMCEQHPEFHFTPQDSDTSPGRVGLNGAKGNASNDSRLWKL